MQPSALKIRVSAAAQRLDVLDGGLVVASFPVSTSAFGLGTGVGSLRTPTGRFRICEMIGHGAPPGMVFRSRIPTGEIGSEASPDDLVQTRILWLDGLDDDNRGTRERYIYIHGTNHESLIGSPASHGCIRMRNADVADLFDRVQPGTEVEVVA